MTSERVPRMSNALRIIGFTLWIPALLMLVLSAACGALVTGTGGSAAERTIASSRASIAAQLRDIPDVPTSAIDAFMDTGAITPEAMAALPATSRTRVESLMSSYSASVAGAALGGAATTGIAGLGVVAVYVVCIPLFIAGLLLTRKKNVWKCPTCGYIFDRA